MESTIISERIRAARENLDITKTEASRRLNLSKIGYCRYVHFSAISGRCSVFERPLFVKNGRPFLILLRHLVRHEYLEIKKSGKGQLRKLTLTRFHFIFRLLLHNTFHFRLLTMMFYHY